MNKQVRRKQQVLDNEQILEVLKNNTSGVLSLIDEQGNPYGVPLNYTYYDGKLLFHSLKVGYKVDLIKHNGKCAFTIIDSDKIVKEEYTSYYKSVIIQGTIKVIEDKETILKYINIFTDKFVPGHKMERDEVIKSSMSALAMLELTIEEWSGKCARSLAKEAK